MEADPEVILQSENMQAIETAERFVNALFAPGDWFLLRPVETWNENGEKKQQVDYHNTRHYKCSLSNNRFVLAHQLRNSSNNRTNLFVGVCPRFGGGGRFDLAWQIRVARAVWVDIDHVTVDEAFARVVQSGLSPPSIVVNSGHGVHLYWLLDEPYLIDDVGDPPAVETERLERPIGKRKVQKFLIENGERIPFDQRRSALRLSSKAIHFQEILAGVAQAVGGDHTSDLPRLLRLPGSQNRKDQRNGVEPVPCTLVECDPSRRYAWTLFESFAKPHAAAEHQRKIAAIPLPRVRKTSAGSSDKLGEMIAACAAADPGFRSEADFALCCFAVGKGIDREEVWQHVGPVGKFAERGREYFDRTWSNAEDQVRAGIFEKAERRAARKGQLTEAQPSMGTDLTRESERDESVPSAAGRPPTGRPTIVVNSSTTPVADTLGQVTDRLLAAGSCFSRTEQLVVINAHRIFPVLSAPELAGLLNQHVEFYFVDEEQGEYKPLPSAYANTWLNHHVERGRLPIIRLFTRNPVFTEDWRLVAPGFDAESGVYYAGPEILPRNGKEQLDGLLQDFCFQTPGDRTNFLGVLLTTVLMPRFIGSKPAVLFNGNQPELGKSILAQTIAILRDGEQAETASYNPNDEEFEKRLGAIVRRGVTTIIIDNAKSRGRNPRIESACLERSITDPVLSFRLLGQSASIRAENSHLFCITANTPDVSRDLVTRSVVVNLHYEGDPVRRRFTIADPEGYTREHRLELLGELIGMVERWKSQGMPLAEAHSRFNKRSWGPIVGGILAACGEPDFLANAETAALELDDVRREFAELVAELADHPQGVWTAAELAEFCEQRKLLDGDLGDGSSRSRATKLGTLAGRFQGERFPLADGRSVQFQKSEGRKGKVYRVVIPEVPNLGPFAEPLPNLVSN